MKKNPKGRSLVGNRVKNNLIFLVLHTFGFFTSKKFENAKLRQHTLHLKKNLLPDQAQHPYFSLKVNCPNIEQAGFSRHLGLRKFSRKFWC